MHNKKINLFLKIFSFTFMWLIIFILLSLFINKMLNYNLRDVLFIVGIIGSIIGIFSLMSGDSIGLSLQSLGQLNSQYNANANFEVNKSLREKKINNVTNSIKIVFNSIYFIISSILCILISYLI